MAITVDRRQTLRRAIRANGLFCMTTGGFVAVASTPVAEFLGLANANTILLLLGVVLVIYGLTIFFFNYGDPRVGWLVTALDVAWVVLSGVVLLLLPFSSGGQIAVIVVALIVLGFAVTQFQALRRD